MGPFSRGFDVKVLPVEGIQKVLFGVERSRVHLAKRLDELETAAQSRRQPVDVVAFDIEAAALEWAVVRESRDNEISARLQGTPQVLEIVITVVFVRKKVKDSSVVPDVVFVFG